MYHFPMSRGNLSMFVSICQSVQLLSQMSLSISLSLFSSSKRTAAIFFVAVTALGGLLMPTMLVALITACTGIATATVRREMSMLKSMREEAVKFPDFYTLNRMRLLNELFDYLDADRGGTLGFDEACVLFGPLACF